MPLLVETLLLAAGFYLLGIGIGFLLFGRRKRTSYLDD
jgi:LPXTG-motif cell wall-anchored protein